MIVLITNRHMRPKEFEKPTTRHTHNKMNDLECGTNQTNVLSP